jgi:hypothetical protein
VRSQDRFTGPETAKPEQLRLTIGYIASPGHQPMRRIRHGGETLLGEGSSG